MSFVNARQITNQFLPFVVLGLPVVVGVVVGVVEDVVEGVVGGVVVVVVFIVVVVVRVSSLLQKSCLQHVFETLSASAQNYNLFGKELFF